jgi:cytochrome P450
MPAEGDYSIVADTFFNPLDADVLRDPYVVYRRLRQEQPVYWHAELGSWLLTRYADCLTVLRDSELFAADFRRVGVPTPGPILSLQTLDPPEQTPLRAFAGEALHSQDMNELEQDMVRRADELVSGLGRHDTFDFVCDVADPFTLGSISHLLGMEPPQRDANWSELNRVLHQSMDSGFSPEKVEAGLAARATFSALMAHHLSEPPDKGMLAFVAANQNAAGVSHDVLVNSVRAFWHAGFEVPSRFLSNAMLALLRDDSALDAVASGISLDVAIEELIRYAGPVQAVSRACTANVTLGGQTLSKGDVVVVLIGAANRDPEQFERPDELIPTRQPNPHLGFGRGAHACLGTGVARLEARVLFSRMLSAYPHLRLAGDVMFHPNATLRGQTQLIVARSPAHDGTLSRAA